MFVVVAVVTAAAAAVAPIFISAYISLTHPPHCYAYQSQPWPHSHVDQLCLGYFAITLITSVGKPAHNDPDKVITSKEK